MELRPRNPPSKSAATAPRKKKGMQKTVNAGRSSSPPADELMAILENDEDADVMDIEDASSPFGEDVDIDVENEIKLLLELCMVDDDVSSHQQIWNSANENSDPNVKQEPNLPNSKQDQSESTKALMNIELGELDGILSPSSVGTTVEVMVDNHDEFHNDATPLVVHDHSAFSPHRSLKLNPRIDQMHAMKPPPPLAHCPRCAFWSEPMAQLKEHFICKLKQRIDESGSEYYKWNSDGQSFTVMDHEETDIMLFELLQPDTAQVPFPAFQHKLFTYGFKRYPQKSQLSYYHPRFHRESVLSDLLWIVEVQKGEIGGGLALHRGCHFAHRDLHSVPPTRDTPLSSPINDPTLDKCIAETLSEIFHEHQDKESPSSSDPTTTMEASQFLALL